MTGRVTAALGALLGVLGLVALVAPGVFSGLPTDRGFVLLLAALLVLGGVRELQRRRSSERNYAETPETEEAIELPTPGDEFDHRFEQLGFARYRLGERERLRDDVADVAVETIARRRGVSTAAARESLEDGSWTDDPYAAALFTGRPPDVGHLEQIREAFRPGMAFKRRTERVAAELSELADRETDGAEGEDG